MEKVDGWHAREDGTTALASEKFSAIGILPGYHRSNHVPTTKLDSQITTSQ